ncbi:MAG: hypothetical protein A2Y81_07080 [Nitrospirae bacterium RBG_13_43_8]|nr:MAG: hypothetical protein A2Y81_07080 [Nitrospirae bacterium RBG_13_43_8]
MNNNNLHDEIAAVAYELYEKSGRIGGRDLVNWSEAEKIVRARYAAREQDESIKSGGKEYIGIERRKQDRVIIRGIKKNILLPVNTRIINISLGGVAVETTEKLHMNKECSLKVNHKGSALRLRGRVIWAILTRIEKKESGDIIPVYEAGIKFQQPLFRAKL